VRQIEASSASRFRPCLVHVAPQDEADDLKKETDTLHEPATSSPFSPHIDNPAASQDIEHLNKSPLALMSLPEGCEIALPVLLLPLLLQDTAYFA
jgi:hypothetical protein